MTQKELFPALETVTCPRCGFVGGLDDFECCGFPDGILMCKQPYPKAQRKKRGRMIFHCFCCIDTRTMTEWDGSGDEEFDE